MTPPSPSTKRPRGRRNLPVVLRAEMGTDDPSSHYQRELIIHDLARAVAVRLAQKASVWQVEKG